MSMTLEEAIDHAVEVSQKKSTCKECREEHSQLAKWLTELKELKKQKIEANRGKCLSWKETHIDTSILDENDKNCGSFSVAYQYVDANGRRHWKTGWFKNGSKRVDDCRNRLHGEGE